MQRLIHKAAGFLVRRPDVVCALTLIAVALTVGINRYNNGGSSETVVVPKAVAPFLPDTEQQPPVRVKPAPVYAPQKVVVNPDVAAPASENEEPEPLVAEASYEKRVERLVERCVETTDAVSVEVVDKGQMHFTVEILSNMAMLTMEQLAVQYFEMLPEDELQVAVSIIDDNGEIAGTRVFPRSAFVR